VDSKMEEIKEIARDVYNTLGSGFSEDVYDRAMQVGLRLAGIPYESQKVVELKYKDHCVGEGYPDLVIHFAEGENLVLEGHQWRTGRIGRPAAPELFTNTRN
jgi:GxxExxY protein